MNTSRTGIKDEFENLVDNTHDLVETAYKLALLETTEQITKVASTTILMSVMLLLINFLLLFLGLGVANWIGDALDDVKLGYFIVGGFYLLLIVLIVTLSKKVVVPYLRNTIVKKLYE